MLKSLWHTYIIRCTLLVVVLPLLVGCDGIGLKPNSGGSPYEVLLVTNDTAVQRIMDAVLEVPVPALPQEERWFSVSHFTGKASDRAVRYARCMVTVETDSTLHGRTRIRYRRDVNARHQLMVTVFTPSATALERDMAKSGQRLRLLMDRFELNTGAENLRRNHNTDAQKAVRAMFGWDIMVPQELAAMKKGKRFLWFSDNGAESSANICVYSYPGTDLDKARWLVMRDSVMGKNIPGERPFMHMKTESRVPVVQRLAEEKGRTMLVSRGLWQMTGDAMGGPFVSLAMADTARGMTMVAEGFVFAPGKRKRDRLKRLEAALYTLAKASEQ